MPVPLAPEVPTVRMVAVSRFASASMETSMPTWKPVVLATFTLVARAREAAASVVGPAANTIALLFSRTTFAAIVPKSQPARVYGTHGAGAFFPSSEIMLKLGSADGSVTSVQYLNDEDEPVVA